ncbi:MAG: amino acid permease [Flavobacteriaceae bacterium]|nr:amino acid permease [Flavobacteriaceae bacterium]
MANKEASQPRLKKALGLRDLILLNIACVVGLSSLTQAAQFGWGSFVLWIAAMVFYLIPSGLMIIDLNSRVPGEGGFYLWTKTAFGEKHAFIAAWCYWLSNIVWFPAVLLTIVLSSLYIFGDQYLDLKEDFWVAGIISLIVLWATILLNIYGLKFGKWLQNIGAIALWLLFGLLFVVALYAFFTVGSAQPFESSKLIPDWTDWGIIPFFAAITFSFGGLELSSVMAGEVKKASKNIIRSVIISAVIIAILYAIGTFSLLVIIPEGDLQIVDGIAQTFYVMDTRIGFPYLGMIGAILVTLSTLGLFASWTTGTARLPFVIGIDRYLPPVLGKIHPRYGTPHIALWVQGILISILLLVAISGTLVEEAYVYLYDMSVLLYFIPFIYMFLALWKHNRRNTGGQSGVAMFRKYPSSARWVVIMGIAIISLSIILAVIPSEAIENKSLFLVKIVGTTVILMGIGALFFFIKPRFS